MKKKILLLAFAVLFSTVNGFAESTSAYWGRIALEHTNYSNAFSEFKKGANEGMYKDCYGPLAVMYAMGLGTPKNPQLAYKYLKLYEENDGFYYNARIRFWLDFYSGLRISDYISYSTFSDVPRVKAFFDSENYTCKAFGQSPDIKKAVEYLYRYAYPIDHLKDEKAAELFLKYALKENDVKLMKMIDEANPNKFAVLEEKDAENYQKLSKDAESLKNFAEETSITIKWREVAKNEYIDTQLNETFKDGGYNQKLDRLAYDVASSWDGDSDRDYKWEYKEKSLEMYYSLFDSLAAAGEWEKVMSLSAHFYDEDAERLLKVVKTLEPIRAKMKSGSISNGELSSAFGNVKYKDFYYKGPSVQRAQAYVSSVMLDIYKSWDKKSNHSEILEMLKMIDFEGAVKSKNYFYNLLKEECKTWDATTDFQYMRDVTVFFGHESEIASHYPRAMAKRIEAWTIDTEAGELDAVYNNIYYGTYLSQVLDFPDCEKAYRVNIEQRLKAVTKIKDVEEAYAKIIEIKGMKYIGKWTYLTEEAERLYVKYAKKMQKLKK